MQVVIDSIVNVILGVFSLTEADWATIGINMILGARSKLGCGFLWPC